MISKINIKKLSKNLPVKNLLALTSNELKKCSSISNPSFCAREIICFVLRKNYQQIIIDQDYPVTQKQIKLIDNIVKKICNGMPLEYATNRSVFCDNTLYINNYVLIPRPETELLVDFAEKEIIKLKPKLIYDVGTGSGAIAIALGNFINKNRIDSRIIALDISNRALNVARHNIKKYKLQKTITLKKSYLLAAVKRPADLIVANLPYVPTRKCKKLADPHIALDGGLRGIDLIFKLIKQIHDYNLLTPDGSIILEIGHNQSKAITNFINKNNLFSSIKIQKDLNDFDRIIVIK